ncbi:hypothetical protein ES703_15523 [subsurface metagenome]
MKEAMKKWLKRHQITFSADTANSICNKFGLEGEKIDGCLMLCYQLDKGEIDNGEFTGGLCVLTGKKPEEVMGILRGVKPEALEDWVVVKRVGGEAVEWSKQGVVIKVGKAMVDKGKRYIVKVGDNEYAALNLEGAKDWAESKMGVLKGMKASPPGGQEIKVQIKPFFGRTDVSGGGIFTLYKGDKEIGHAMVAFEHKDITYPISGFVPAKTAVMDTMEINEEERGKGYGSKFVDEIERIAKEQGMETMYLTSVMGESEEFWRKQGYQFSGHKRIWIKELSGKKPEDKLAIACYNALANHGIAVHYTILGKMVRRYYKPEITDQQVLSCLSRNKDLFRRLEDYPGAYFLAGKKEGQTYPEIGEVSDPKKD